MSRRANGGYEPDGLCIWVNTDSQKDLSEKNTGVLSHEFTHYVHSISTYQSTRDLITLLFVVHPGIQRIEELSSPPHLPLDQWPKKGDCPREVADYLSFVQDRRRSVEISYRTDLDPLPPKDRTVGSLYTEGERYFIKTSVGKGAPIARLTLMEGAALAKKCEAVGNDSDLYAKRTNPKLARYFATYEACVAASKGIDPMAASSYLCDISLCSNQPGRIFELGLEMLASLSSSATISDFEGQMVALYDQECRRSMNSILDDLVRLRAALPANHFSEENPSWPAVILADAIAAVRLRQGAPLSLIRPVYLGESLFNLTSVIGSPVIVTNDMRLTSLSVAPLGVVQARNLVRLISYLCEWVISEEGPLRCPYAGCPGCPDERAGKHCWSNAAIALLPPDDRPWCSMLSAAKQLRVSEVLRDSVHRC